MSAIPLTEIGNIYHYDFSNALPKAYNAGHNHVGNGVYGMIGGDGLANGNVNQDDKTNVWELQAGEQGYKEGDFNLNRQVANPDKNEIWKPNNGSQSQIPQ